jgi:hypothetical protein
VWLEVEYSEKMTAKPELAWKGCTVKGYIASTLAAVAYKIRPIPLLYVKVVGPSLPARAFRA